MKRIGTLLAFLALVLLAALRFGGSHMILAAAPHPYGARLVSALGVLTMTAVALLIDQLVRAYYWDGHLRRRRGRETPAVIEGMLTIALVVLAVSLGLFFEAGVSFAGVLTASGATAFVLGIALQAVINDIFSGLSVNVEGLFAIGDWLTIYSEQFPEPIYGRVQGIQWRTTLLRLNDGRRLMVPNHMLTSNPVMNHSRPPGAKRLFVDVPVANFFPADRAQAILLAEAYRTVRVKPLSAAYDPDVLIDRFSADTVFFHVRFYAELDESDPQNAKSIMAHALHRALLRHKVPTPIGQMRLFPAHERIPEEEEARSALRHVPIFTKVLKADQLDALVQGCEERAFPPGSIFIHQGQTDSSMFVILEGAARISIAMPDGEVREVAVLAVGDIVGEMSLMTGAPRAASVRSLTAMRVLEVTKDAIEPLLAAEPSLLERFSDVLATRQSGLSEIASSPAQKKALQSDILAQMRRFFSRAFH